jgi:hypothetical protein
MIFFFIVIIFSLLAGYLCTLCGIKCTKIKFWIIIPLEIIIYLASIIEGFLFHHDNIRGCSSMVRMPPCQGGGLSVQVRSPALKFK